MKPRRQKYFVPVDPSGLVCWMYAAVNQSDAWSMAFGAVRTLDQVGPYNAMRTELLRLGWRLVRGTMTLEESDR